MFGQEWRQKLSHDCAIILLFFVYNLYFSIQVEWLIFAEVTATKWMNFVQISTRKLINLDFTLGWSSPQPNYDVVTVFGTISILIQFGTILSNHHNILNQLGSVTRLPIGWNLYAVYPQCFLQWHHLHQLCKIAFSPTFWKVDNFGMWLDPTGRKVKESNKIATNQEKAFKVFWFQSWAMPKFCKYTSPQCINK